MLFLPYACMIVSVLVKAAVSTLKHFKAMLYMYISIATYYYICVASLPLTPNQSDLNK